MEICLCFEVYSPNIQQKHFVNYESIEFESFR